MAEIEYRQQSNDLKTKASAQARVRKLFRLHPSLKKEDVRIQSCGSDWWVEVNRKRLDLFGSIIDK